MGITYCSPQSGQTDKRQKGLIVKPDVVITPTTLLQRRRLFFWEWPDRESYILFLPPRTTRQVHTGTNKYGSKNDNRRPSR